MNPNMEIGKDRVVEVFTKNGLIFVGKEVKTLIPHEDVLNLIDVLRIEMVHANLGNGQMQKMPMMHETQIFCDNSIFTFSRKYDILSEKEITSQKFLEGYHTQCEMVKDVKMRSGSDIEIVKNQDMLRNLN